MAPWTRTDGNTYIIKRNEGTARDRTGRMKVTSKIEMFAEQEAPTTVVAVLTYIGTRTMSREISACGKLISQDQGVWIRGDQ